MCASTTVRIFDSPRKKCIPRNEMRTRSMAAHWKQLWCLSGKTWLVQERGCCSQFLETVGIRFTRHLPVVGKILKKKKKTLQKWSWPWELSGLWLSSAVRSSKNSELVQGGTELRVGTKCMEAASLCNVALWRPVENEDSETN